MRQRLRVQPIGLRQAPGGSGEVAHLAGIDHHDRKVGNTQLRHEGRLIASGRLDHDHLGADRLQPHHQLSAPRRVIAQLTLVAARADGHLQRRFGPIDPNDHVLLPLPNFFSVSLVAHADPALQDTGSAHGWPWQLFGLLGARRATTPALLRPHGTEGRTACRAHLQHLTAPYYMTFQIQGMIHGARLRHFRRNIVRSCSAEGMGAAM